MKKFVLFIVLSMAVIASVNALERSEKIRGPDLSGQFAISNTSSNYEMTSQLICFDALTTTSLKGSDILSLAKDFEFATLTANKSADLMTQERNSGNYDATCTWTTPNPVETKKATGGADNVIWPVNSDFGYSPNNAEKICQGPFMVLKKPLTVLMSMNFAKTEIKKSMQKSSSSHASRQNIA